MEQIVTSQLDVTLAEIFQSLANFFGTTVEYISQNASVWLAKYGWYSVVKGLGLELFGGLGIVGLFLLIYLGIGIMIFDDIEANFKAHKGFIILGGLVCLLLPAFLSIIPCMIAPELVGLEALLQTIGGT